MKDCENVHANGVFNEKIKELSVLNKSFLIRDFLHEFKSSKNLIAVLKNR